MHCPLTRLATNLQRTVTRRFASTNTMTAKLSIDKNHHHLRVDGKEGKPIDFKALRTHVKIIATKYAVHAETTQGGLAAASKASHPHPGGEDKDHDVPLDPQVDAALWTGPIEFGGQKALVDFDTGSTSIVLNKSAYVPTKSKSSEKTTSTFEARYGDGTSTKGEVYKDEVVIAGLKVPDVAIGLAGNDYLTKDKDGNSVGLVGLAYPTLDRLGHKENTLFDAMIKAKVLKSNIFSFAISKKTGESELTFGDVSDKAKNDPHWVKIDSKIGFWQVPASINGRKIESIVDSGTTLIIAPYKEAQALLASIKGLTIQTDEKDFLYATYEGEAPETKLQYGDKIITLSQEACNAGKDTQGRNVFSIVGEDMGISDSAYVVGDPLFQSSVITFDRDHDRVGFSDYK